MSTPETHGWHRDIERQAVLRQAAPFQDWEGEPPVVWTRGPLLALVSRDLLLGESTPRWWHISVQHHSRVPSWEELARAAHELRPGVPMAAGIPPRSWWINVHPRVLHLWEVRDEPLIAQWRAERRGDEPS